MSPRPPYGWSRRHSSPRRPGPDPYPAAVDVRSALPDLVEVRDVGAIVVLRRGRGVEPGVEDLLQDSRGGRPQREREHVGVVPPAGARGGGGSPHSAARMPRTLLAAIEAPVPVQQ